MSDQFILTRDQYDALQIRLVRLLGCPADEARSAIECSYPIPTSHAIDEARKRGVLANQYRMELFVAAHPDIVPRCGKSRMWSKAAVDLFVAELTDAGLFTDINMVRREAGETAQQTVDRIAAELDEKIAEQERFLQAAQKTVDNVAGQKITYAAN